MDFTENKYFVHPSAIVDEGAKVGDQSKIWHFSHIMSGAVIGENCSLGQNTFIANKVVIGSGCKIQNNVSLYEGVELGDDVFVGPSVVFTNVINPRAQVNRKSEYKATIIEEGVSIGANATILCGIKIGKFAFIGAGSVVTKDVDNYSLIKGNPGRHSGWMSEHGASLIFEQNKAICPISKIEYQRTNNHVEKI